MKKRALLGGLTLLLGLGLSSAASANSGFSLNIFTSAPPRPVYYERVHYYEPVRYVERPVYVRYYDRHHHWHEKDRGHKHHWKDDHRGKGRGHGRH
ncbi:MAG: hypothetical protein FJX23_00475 [Alphaproteobacteria bacterium]|nr:hypothetical protein [Alphaproteobacteria bacterium]